MDNNYLTAARVITVMNVVLVNMTATCRTNFTGHLADKKSLARQEWCHHQANEDEQR